MDNETRDAIKLLWDQGINVIRHDVQELAKGITSSKRWLVGLVISVIPAYAGTFFTIYVLLTRR